MAKTFHLEIIATDRVFFSGEVEHLVITAIDGLLGRAPRYNRYRRTSRYNGRT